MGIPGSNCWKFDPIAGVVYSSAKNRFNALLNMSYVINTGNSATNYTSCNLLHFDGSLQQLLPLGSGFVSLGAEGFYFNQGRLQVLMRRGRCNA